MPETSRRSNSRRGSSKKTKSKKPKKSKTTKTKVKTKIVYKESPESIARRKTESQIKDLTQRTDALQDMMYRNAKNNRGVLESIEYEGYPEKYTTAISNARMNPKLVPSISNEKEMMKYLLQIPQQYRNRDSMTTTEGNYILNNMKENMMQLLKNQSGDITKHNEEAILNEYKKREDEIIDLMKNQNSTYLKSAKLYRALKDERTDLALFQSKINVIANNYQKEQEPAVRKHLKKLLDERLVLLNDYINIIEQRIKDGGKKAIRLEELKEEIQRQKGREELEKIEERKEMGEIEEESVQQEGEIPEEELVEGEEEEF